MPFRYPVALELSGRRCVVTGGGREAEGKARALLEAEADVVVIAPRVSDGLGAIWCAGERSPTSPAVTGGATWPAPSWSSPPTPTGPSGPRSSPKQRRNGCCATPSTTSSTAISPFRRSCAGASCSWPSPPVAGPRRWPSACAAGSRNSSAGSGKRSSTCWARSGPRPARRGRPTSPPGRRAGTTSSTGRRSCSDLLDEGRIDEVRARVYDALNPATTSAHCSGSVR